KAEELADESAVFLDHRHGPVHRAPEVLGTRERLATEQRLEVHPSCSSGLRSGAYPGRKWSRRGLKHTSRTSISTRAHASAVRGATARHGTAGSGVDPASAVIDGASGAPYAFAHAPGRRLSGHRRWLG